MIIKNRQTTLLFFSVVLMLGQAESIASDDSPYRVAGFQFDIYPDGRCEMAYVVKNSRNGRVKEMSFEEFQKVSPATELQPLLVDSIARWPPGSEIVYEMTPDFVEDRQKYQEVIDKYFNGRRGSIPVPKIKIGDRVFDKDLPADRASFWGDGRNTIIVTSDDRYLGQAYGRGTFVINQYTYEIVETDAFFRYKFFESPYTDNDYSHSPNYYLDPRKVVVHEFGHCTGLLHATWNHEIMLGYYITDKTFEDERSRVWRQWKKRNRIYYDIEYSSVPRIAPPEGSVIDLTNAIAPDNVSDDMKVHYIMVFAITNLKGIPGKPMKMDIYPGWLEPSLIFNSSDNLESASAKEDQEWLEGVRPLVEMTGYSVETEGRWVIPPYYASRIRIGQEQYWGTLIEELETNGKTRNIYGVDYEKSLKVTVVVTGYMDINSDENSSVVGHYYIVAPLALAQRKQAASNH